MRTIEHWIDGRTTSGASTRHAPVYNPASGEQQAQVVLATKGDVDTAVAGAAKAFESWSQASLSKRAGSVERDRCLPIGQRATT